MFLPGQNEAVLRIPVVHHQVPFNRFVSGRSNRSGRVAQDCWQNSYWFQASSSKSCLFGGAAGKARLGSLRGPCPMAVKAAPAKATIWVFDEEAGISGNLLLTPLPPATAGHMASQHPCTYADRPGHQLDEVFYQSGPEQESKGGGARERERDRAMRDARGRHAVFSRRGEKWTKTMIAMEGTSGTEGAQGAAVHGS